MAYKQEQLITIRDTNLKLQFIVLGFEDGVVYSSRINSINAYTVNKSSVVTAIRPESPTIYLVELNFSIILDLIALNGDITFLYNCPKPGSGACASIDTCTTLDSLTDGFLTLRTNTAENDTLLSSKDITNRISTQFAANLCLPLYAFGDEDSSSKKHIQLSSALISNVSTVPTL